MAVELGTAYISVVPETKDFERKLKSVVDKSSVTVDVDAETSGAKSNVIAWRKSEESNHVTVDVDAETSGASSNVSRWRNVEESNHVNIRVDADTKAANTQVKGLRRNIEDLGRSDLIRIGVSVAGISSLPALAAGLAQVAAAMQSVASVALAVPGAIAGVASSVGTLAFGMSGVKDAYDAMNKAADDAASSGSDVAAQARAQQSASYSLRNAIVDEAQARKDVAQATRDARRELTDLNVEMRGGVISEKRAVLEAQQAREALAKGDFTDLRDQLLRIEEADQRLIEVRVRNAQTAEDLTDANVKGVEGSDQVVAANERVTRSAQQVDQAQSAVAASAPKASASQEAAALALGKLSPNAREFAEALMDVQGPVMALRNLVGENIFAGMADQLRGLSSKAMPTLEKGLGGIGDAWNATFTELFDVLGSDQNMSILDRIFGNTADAQKLLNGAIDPLVEGVGVLAAAGSDALPRLADAFVDVSERFSDFITSADEDGRLAEWIDEGITSFGHLGETVLNIGKMFTGITEAAGGGASLMENLEKWTNNIQSWINSAEGQGTLTGIFDEGRRIFAEWKPILESIPGIFLGIYNAASQYMGGVIQVVTPLVTFLSDHPDLVATAAGAYLLFKSVETIGAIATLASNLGGVGKDLDAMPDKASKASRGINSAFSLIVVPAIGKMLTDEIDKFLEENFPDIAKANKSNTPDQLGKRLRDWVDENVLGGPSPQDVGGAGSLSGGVPQSQLNAPAGTRESGGVTPRSSTGTPSAQANAPAGTRESGLATYSNESSKVSDTGGSVLPGTQGLIDRYKSWGLTDIGGYREPDGFNEHSSGKAADVMIPNWQTEEGIAKGNAVKDDAMKLPGVQYAIWRNKMWYPDGTSKPYSGYGATSDPNLMHMNHVHIKTYDNGGWWPSGTLGINKGDDEYVLTPEQLEEMRKQGIDPATVHHGTAAPPGPAQPGQPAQQPVGGPYPQTDPELEQLANINGAGRQEGYIPAGAGFSGKTGGGLAGSFIGMGGEALKGVIDQAAGAASMGANVMAPGSGQAIQMGAAIAKRGVDYATEMAGIGIGALSEIFMPFGAPRWLNDVDPSSFVPQQAMTPAVTTTSEQAVQDLQSPLGPQPHGQGGAPGPQSPLGPQPPAGLDFIGRATQQTADAVAPPPSPPMVNVENITAADSGAVGESIAKGQRLAMMRFAGRP